MVHACRNAVLILRALRVRRKLQHVRARRRVPRGQGSAGGNAREILRLGADVRLRFDRTDQRRFRRSISHGLLNELFAYFHLGIQLSENSTAAMFAVLVTIFFWWENIKGVHESSDKALKIMQITTVMVAVLIVWCMYTVWVRGAHLPPFPTPSNIQLDKRSLGWLYGHEIVRMIPLIAVFVGIGHSVLAMSGEESLAQVYREIEAPKLPNLKKAGLIIFVYSLVFTSLVSFFAVMIIR